MSLVRLRTYPYPYRAALTICSDLDCVTPEDFLQIHRFLNTTQATPMGEGVGLEIADSFWLYSAQPDPAGRLTYFNGLEPVESPWASMILAFIQAGYIDCLHAYGDFNHYGGFRRQMAARAVEVLRDRGVRLAVWTNHGDRHNFQNLGEAYSLGDVERSQSADGDWFASAEYHADLTRALGVKFLWRSADLTQVWGQDRPLRVTDVCSPERLRHPRTTLRWFTQQRRAAGGLPRANALLKPVQLRDGSSLVTFRRYGRFHQDRADDLERVLSDSHLRRLVRDETVAVIYTHLGKRCRADGPPIPAGAQTGLRRLARAAQEGRVLVTTTSRLLAYCHMRSQVRDTVTEERESLRIVLEPGFEPRELAGLTWYVDSPKRVRVFRGERELEVRANPLDHTGRASVSVPWIPLDPRRLDRYLNAVDV